jgi:hypothetical protein
MKKIENNTSNTVRNNTRQYKYLWKTQSQKLHQE